MGKTESLQPPDGTNQVVVLSKTRNWMRVFEGRRKKESRFFSGYPTQSLFQEQMEESEWNRLDAEFLTVWNNAKGSQTNAFCKCLFLFPGVYLLLIPTWWIFKRAREREEAMQELVAKVNKYIFRPRNMYMKEMTDMSHQMGFGGWVEMAWYEIALTQDEIARLEETDTFDMDAVYAFRWRDPSNDYVNEHTVETDEAFQSRWSKKSS